MIYFKDNMDERIRVIYRKSEPNKQDTADHLTICKVCDGKSISEKYWLQLNRDADYPRWEYLGELLDIENVLIKLVDLLK